MSNLLTTALTGAALLYSVAAMGADTRTAFTYSGQDAEIYRLGTKKVETYDIAIRIDDPALVGKRIIGVEAPMITDQSVANPSAWITKELAVVSKVNQVDVSAPAQWSTTVSDSDLPTLQATFAEPYTITEGGVYVGYSITMEAVDTDSKKAPIAVTVGGNDNAFFIHSSRTFLKWRTRKEALLDGAVSCMRVIIEGDFKPYAVGVASMAPLLMQPNTPTPLKLQVVNHGSTPVTDIDYTYTIGTDAPEVAGHYTFSTPLAAQYGSAAEIEIPVTTSLEPATYPISVNIKSVNGQPNDDSTASATGEVGVIAFVPVTRPLVEEYTGTWCGYCPRGFIAMERLNHLYGDRFLGLAFHAGSGGSYEPMQMVKEFPTNVDGFPMAVVNRTFSVDPYYGNTNMEHMGITRLWEQLASQIADADVNVTLSWDDATHLRAKAQVRFLKDSNNADYRISFALTGDNLTGEAWNGTPDMWYQSNNFAGESADAFPGDDWKVFTQGGKVVVGLTFNDVVLKYDNPRGLAGSLPAEIKANELIEVEEVFDLSTVRNAKGHDIVNDPTSLRVAAIVTKGTAGTYVNGHKSAKAGASTGSNTDALDGIATDLTPVNEQWHDLQGRPLSGPAPVGITLRTVTLPDGTVRTTKHLAR